jgi:hypothetical protein
MGWRRQQGKRAKNLCRSCGAECLELVCAACLLDARATRWLAGEALKARALDGADFDFIDEEPMRADEVAEFTNWLGMPLREYQVEELQKISKLFPAVIEMEEA